MSEAQMWSRLRPVLAGWGLDPVRIENSVDLGTPDVNLTTGWVELKYAAEWPKGEATPLRLDHFTPEQRAWLTRRWVRGQNCWLLLHVREGDWWGLFTGRDAADYVGRLSREGLGRVARVAVGSPSAPGLRSALEGEGARG